MKPFLENHKKYFKPIIISLLILSVFIGFGLVYLEKIQKKITIAADGLYVDFARANSLKDFFNEHGYNLDEIKQNKDSVPRIFVENLPKDMAKIKDNKQQKELFIKIMLPIILKVNLSLSAKREQLIELLKKINNNEKISLEQKREIEELAKKYEVLTTMSDEKEQNRIIVEQLIFKIGEIPTSLALAQAILESNFGTSYYAIKYNAIFGILDWDGNGIVPKKRPKDETYTIKNYPTIASAVEDYALHLNRDITFESFRMLRRHMRTKSFLDGRFTSGGVMEYLNRGLHYVLNIRKTMAKEKIRNLDRVTLKIKQEAKQGDLDGKDNR